MKLRPKLKLRKDQFEKLCQIRLGICLNKGCYVFDVGPYEGPLDCENCATKSVWGLERLLTNADVKLVGALGEANFKLRQAGD